MNAAQLALDVAPDPLDLLDMTGDPVAEPLPPDNPCRCGGFGWPDENGEIRCAMCGREPNRCDPDPRQSWERET